MPLLNESQERGSDGHSIQEARDLKPSKSPSGWLDKVLLFSTALLVGVTTVGSFWLAERFHVRAVWVFAAWNSILIVPLFIADFRAHLTKPSFVVFLVVWAVIHGLLVATLMRWFTIPAMLPFLAIELIAGLLAADYFFGIQPVQREKK